MTRKRKRRKEDGARPAPRWQNPRVWGGVLLVMGLLVVWAYLRLSPHAERLPITAKVVPHDQLALLDMKVEARPNVLPNASSPASWSLTISGTLHNKDEKPSSLATSKLVLSFYDMSGNRVFDSEEIPVMLLVTQVNLPAGESQGFRFPIPHEFAGADAGGLGRVDVRIETTPVTAEDPEHGKEKEKEK